MVYLALVLMLPLWAPADGGSPPGSLPQTARAPYLRLPVFVHSWQPLVDKEHFSPARGTGQEPLPGPVRGLLLPARPTAAPPGGPGASVRVSCAQNKMHVQVHRSVLGTGEPLSRLRLGTCHATTSTADHVHFEHELGTCGTTSTIRNNQVVYSNTLQYDPLRRVLGPIRRAVPFTLPVACYYNRYQYSYKIGYIPKMRMRKMFKSMKNRGKFLLTPRNAQWERLSPSDHYVLGEPMYFEAEALSTSEDERLYLHSCYATRKMSDTSTPQFPVVTNFGCMVESQHSRSRFIPYKNNVVRFSVDAFLFKGMTGQQLYMHCTMSVSSSDPTPTTKSCNYDTQARRWVELYGADSVCTCCDSSCSAATSTDFPATKLISSRSWKMEPEVKPTKTPKRKTVSTTTTTTTTAAASQPETTRELTAWWTFPKPETITVSPMGKVENTELDWPFRGEGVKRVEEEKQAKGPADVDEEAVTQRRIIFEEIFDFDE